MPPSESRCWAVAAAEAGPAADDSSLAHCRVWLDWAATQIEGSLANDSAECDRLIAGLAEMLRAAERRAPGTAADDTVEQKMSRVVIAVQSHDRLMQQLSHVAGALRGLHEHLGSPGQRGSVDRWRELGERQLRAFSMPEERLLFAEIIGAGTGVSYNPAAGPNDESLVDLFGEIESFEEPSA